MQAAGKWEQEHPEETALCEEVDDTCDDGNSEIEEVEDEIEDEENDCGVNGEPGNIAVVKVPDVDDRDVPQCALARSKFEAAKRTADHSNGGEIKKCTGGVTLDKKGEGGGDCMASNEHGSTTTPSTAGVVPPSSDRSDVACIAVVERNAVDQGEAISSKRIRLGKQNT
ncbi:hypothetical protein TELCIR_01096 [Teladorsagia circumcincta]|uniref:Uncharacterized protein n=1 Tax=Teladorsagia circumcincta TaxID=45464 RepID=A0A2G9V2U4_TELCI|nr:hypothetical protein TELCIR_01096 [Teladorsagia circumcincta]